MPKANVIGAGAKTTIITRKDNNKIAKIVAEVATLTIIIITAKIATTITQTIGICHQQAKQLD